MDASVLSVHGRARGADFYRSALSYAHYLWQRRLAARAMLALDRALGADLRGDEPVLQDWPVPYAALAWFLRHTPTGVFIGNPRVHFQHLAGRMNEPRREQRRWRAWAGWGLTRAILPDLPGDPKHSVVEPSVELIARKLAEHGLPGESLVWQTAMKNAEV